MQGIFEYYRKKVDKNGNVIFELIDENDIKICNYTIPEIITIIDRINSIKGENNEKNR